MKLLESLGFCSYVGSCCFVTPWNIRFHLFCAFAGMSGLGGQCDGKCNHVSLQSWSSCGTKRSVLAQPVWPGCAAAIAEAFDGIMGTTVSPKCAHLAGIMASEFGSSVLHCLDSVGFKPSGHRATSTVAARAAACIQPTERLPPALLPEGFEPEALHTASVRLPSPGGLPHRGRCQRPT